MKSKYQKLRRAGKLHGTIKRAVALRATRDAQCAPVRDYKTAYPLGLDMHNSGMARDFIRGGCSMRYVENTQPTIDKDKHLTYLAYHTDDKEILIPLSYSKIYITTKGTRALTYHQAGRFTKVYKCTVKAGKKWRFYVDKNKVYFHKTTKLPKMVGSASNYWGFEVACLVYQNNVQPWDLHTVKDKIDGERYGYSKKVREMRKELVLFRKLHKLWRVGKLHFMIDKYRTGLLSRLKLGTYKYTVAYKAYHNENKYRHWSVVYDEITLYEKFYDIFMGKYSVKVFHALNTSGEGFGVDYYICDILSKLKKRLRWEFYKSNRQWNTAAKQVNLMRGQGGTDFL